MASIIKRITKRCRMTRANWKSDCHFSISMALFRLISDLGKRIGLAKIANLAKAKKEEYVLGYLRNAVWNVIKKYHNYDNNGVYQKNAPIWVCWWTGIESAPPIVQQCVRSIYQNAGSHPVYLITKANYKDYIDVPSYILEKLLNGKMKTAHFADYLRVVLIEKYGGLWVDATIFCSRVISDEYFELPFYTCKSERIKGDYLSGYQWTTFCLGGWQHNIFFQFMREAFESYWMQNDFAIDYLFFDDLIYIAKQHIPAIAEKMDKVPVNNVHRDDLQDAMNLAKSAEEFERILQEDTIFYKLSWRENYLTENDHGKTVYGYFLDL